MRYFRILVLILFLGVLFTDCANIGTLTGGDKDTIPPIIVESKPEIGTVNFSQQKIEFEFDEFFVLDNMRSSFYSSPPMEEYPDFKIKGKSLIVKFNEALKDSLTYYMNFGSAVKDYHENNPLKNFAFVFSTGLVIDSMNISGAVFDAQTQEAEQEIPVFLYAEHRDSVPSLQTPLYYTKTDTSGNFSFNYIKPGKYKIFTLWDNDGNMRFNLPNEKIGFLDSLIVPEVVSEIFSDTLKAGTTTGAGDTLTQDSINRTTVNTYSPDNIYLFSFLEDNDKQYNESFSRLMPGRLELTYKRPVADLDLMFPTLGLTTSDTLAEYSNKGRTLTIWLNDSSAVQKDSILMHVSYQSTDSAKMPVVQVDSLLFVADSLTYDTAKYSNLTFESEDKGHYFENYKLRFNMPLSSIDTSRMELYQLIDTSVVDAKEQKLSSNMRPAYNRLLFTFLRPVEDFSLSMNGKQITGELTVNTSRDTIQYLLPDSVGNIDTLNINAVYDNQYFFGQTQKLKSSLSMTFTEQKITQLKRENRDQLDFRFIKPQTEKITIKEIFSEQNVDYTLSISENGKHHVVTLTKPELIQADTLVLSLEAPDGRLPNGNKASFADTLSVIYQPIKQYLKTSERTSAQGFYLLFNRETKPSDIQVYLPDSNQIKPILTEQDSLYFDQRSWRKTDTLKVKMNYLNERGVRMRDSVNLTLEKKKTTDRFKFTTKEEERSKDLKNIVISKAIGFEAEIDSLAYRTVSIDFDAQAGYSYLLKTDSSAFLDIYANKYKSADTKFSLYSKEEYGKLFINLTNVGNIERDDFYELTQNDSIVSPDIRKGKFILYLYTAKDEKLIDQVSVVGDTVIVFDNLLPKEYKLKGLYDANNNNQWDTGNYYKHIRPERVLVVPKPISFKKGWEINTEWNLLFHRKKR
ncbi:MAG: Ig-like domain-containing domain [Bacteroidota bacterium]|nr:Ig-like domain-containing domain [Bacteroidota bacterium]